MLAKLTLVAAALLVPETTDPLPGCRVPMELSARLSELRAADWLSWTRATLGKRWPEHLEFGARDSATQEVVEFRRSGRVIDGKLECGETYLFEPPLSGAGDYLREFSVRHAEPNRPDALAAAKLLIGSIDPPPTAEEAHVICIHCEDPGEQLLSRQWVVGGQTHMIRANLSRGVGTFVVAIVWSRRPGR